jgi:hypothetical protein
MASADMKQSMMGGMIGSNLPGYLIWPFIVCSEHN